MYATQSSNAGIVFGQLHSGCRGTTQPTLPANLHFVAKQHSEHLSVVIDDSSH